MPNNNYPHSTIKCVEHGLNGHAVVHAERPCKYELRSEEVQEVMTKMPSIIIRQGTSVLFAVIFFLFMGAYFIHFPDVVTTPAHIKPVYSNADHTQDPNNASYLATAILPVEMAGKVKAGQQVLIKLTFYPYQQFGILKGEVEDLSADVSASAYEVRIRLTNGLVTSTNKKIHANALLSGTAEVLTTDKTLLQRLFERIHSN